MIKVISVFIISFCSLSGYAQKKGKKQPMAWLTVEEVQQQWSAEKRPILIDVYTDWCHYCKVMDNSTWQHKELTDYTSKYFYPVKFNAESKTTVAWMGKAYEFKPAYKVHMLAAEWLQGNMIYPSTVIIPPDGEPIILPGVMDAKEMEPILQYFGEKHYLNTEWQVFKTNYKSGWK
jgi:uncharacterized protein YyaL (SSP411 family)